MTDQNNMLLAELAKFKINPDDPQLIMIQKVFIASEPLKEGAPKEELLTDTAYAAVWTSEAEARAVQMNMDKLASMGIIAAIASGYY